MENKENPVDKICRELGVNQKRLSEMMGVSQNSISNWKNKKKKAPSWTDSMFELLKIKKEYIEYRKFVENTTILNNSL